ncbi:hypothetical protein DID88_008541 [Monilinia fructigena]|uniref:RNA-dependent RNA polymerase n=1 Tax=Monilinia fructigena TaxID=38457 RepID=A0A395J6R6_9HELO|nr:hypothetical protein DID88_008541 [Monilinia fructigena]
MQLDSPPQFYRWRDDRDVTLPGALSWTEWDSWFRQTDIVYDPFMLVDAPIALHKERPVIDIGRWTTYRSKRLYDPSSIFGNNEALSFSSATEIPHYCAFSRKATITPSSIYFSSPTVETTNRVLRHYAKENKEGRFLRVQFTDEKFEGRINACADKIRNDGIFTRVFRTISNGIRIGPSKVFRRPDIVRIPDIERNGHCFTDGVGKISSFLAQMIAAELKLRTHAAPSAFQFRLGGCKGILVVSPDAKDKEVHIRKTQQKFTAVYNGLEIIRCSQFSSATLNRQTITILSSLGVKDEVFLKMLSEQLSDYQNAMSNNTIALNLLNRYIDDNHMTINIASMILNGFMTEKEPGYTKPTVAFGTTYKEDELPQIFIQVPDRDNPTQYNVIEGICLVGRNPSLHPGDLRVVQAINVPALHHLRDVVVFPQNGERDVPSMCSGGDLDGDDFFVIWDKDLQPSEWNCEPMNYTALQPLVLGRPVEVRDLMKFFVKYMKNDSLPTIAHAHLAQADLLPQGIKDPKCLKLAELHSKAVDYVKTGQPANMPRSLAPQKWPHFMEKVHKPQSKQYHSSKILGQLYDRVESVHFVPQWEQPFDKRILRAYKLDNAVLKAARQTKTKYDIAMRRILAQQDIKTEFEVWSTFVLSKPKVGSDYKLQEEMALITGALKDRFRLVCVEKAGGKDFSVLGPFVAAMYKVTKEELDIALAECRATRLVNGMEVPKRQMKPQTMPLISFPWLFEKELGRIATGIEATDEFEEVGFHTFGINKPQVTATRRKTELSRQEDDFVKQENGVVVHRGELLSLFEDENSDDEFGWDEEKSDVGSATSTPAFMPTMTTGYAMLGDGAASTPVETKSGPLHYASSLQHPVHSTNLQGQDQAMSQMKHTDSGTATESDCVEPSTLSSLNQNFSPPALSTKARSDSNLSGNGDAEGIVEEMRDVAIEPSMSDKLSFFVD